MQRTDPPSPPIHGPQLIVAGKELPKKEFHRAWKLNEHKDVHENYERLQEDDHY